MPIPAWSSRTHLSQMPGYRPAVLIDASADPATPDQIYVIGEPAGAQVSRPAPTSTLHRLNRRWLWRGAQFCRTSSWQPECCLPTPPAWPLQFQRRCLRNRTTDPIQQRQRSSQLRSLRHPGQLCRLRPCRSLCRSHPPFGPKNLNDLDARKSGLTLHRRISSDCRRRLVRLLAHRADLCLGHRLQHRRQ